MNFSRSRPRLPAFYLTMLFVSVLMMANPLLASFEIHATNDVAIDGEGWIHPTSGDPYLIFRSGSVDPTSYPVLMVEVEGKNVLNRHTYTELFWATEQHGFSEEFKGFYIVPFSPDKKPEAVYLNFHEFLMALGDTSKSIDLIRLDLEPSLRETDFECRFKLRWVTTEEVASGSLDVIPIHPPFLSRYLLKPGIIEYTTYHLSRDILHRTFRDWLFVILYFGSLSLIVFLLWKWRKPPNKA